jgi:type 1 fimbria pilin
MTPLVTQPVTTGSLKIKHTPAQGKLVPEHNQIQINLPNGYSVSIVYGGATYSTNLNGERFLSSITEIDRASTVEIAIVNPQGNFVPFKDGEQVKGFTPITEVLTILNWVSTQK